MGASKRSRRPEFDHDGARILGQSLWKRYATRQAAQLAKTERREITEFASEAHKLIRRPPLATVPMENRFFVDFKDWQKRTKERRIHHSQQPPPPPPPKPDKIDVLFVHRGGYTFGAPNPEYFNQPPHSLIEGIGSTTVEEYADPLIGLISLGFVGGNQFYTQGGLMMSSPLPEHFRGVVPFDGVSVAASIYDVADITNIKKNTNLSIEALLYCPVRNSNPNNLEDSVSGLYALYPGLATAPLSGFVTVRGYFDLTVSSVLNGRVMNTSTNTLFLLQRSRNNGTGPGNFGAYFKTLVDDCVFIVPTTVGNTVGLTTNIHITTADHLIIQAQVRLQGLRAGNNNPGAGYVGAMFQSISKQVTNVDIGAFGYPCPFQVSSIAAFIT